MNKMTKSKKLNTLFFIVSLLLIAVTMFVFIAQKEGFHEDEIYSYGSSNSKYSDIFYASADRDATNRVVNEYIIDDDFKKTYENYKYYKNNPDEFKALEEEKITSELPVWKTPEEAKDYLVVSEDEITNYISPYYHQTRDVHPPLFYFLVHLVSSLFAGTFTKYSIFFINLIFLLATCLVLRKILILFNREKLVVPATLLYGLCMGTISMAVFLRMYSMLTFFVTLYFYITLKIVKNDFKITKGTAVSLIITTVLGFLTQYYFCIFALSVFILMCIRMLTLKKVKPFVRYALYHIISAFIGLLLFPSAIDHIFNSSRGIGSTSGLSFFAQLEVMIGRITYAFSMHRFIGVAVFLLILSYIFVRCIEKNDAPKEKSAKLFNIFLFVVPIVVYIALVSKLSPNLDEKTMIRYITPVLPLMSISFLVFVEKLISSANILKENGKNIFIYAIVFIMTLSGFIFSSPCYLYRGYNNYLEVANEYKDLNYVYVYDNYFTHLNSVPEMAIYNKTLIINLYDEKQKNVLSTDEEIQKSEKFILSLKKWMDTDEALKEVLSQTGYEKADVLLDQEDDTQSILYLISK